MFKYYWKWALIVLYLFGAGWVFNHMDAWAGIILLALFIPFLNFLFSKSIKKIINTLKNTKNEKNN